ncbi:MAG: biopolymer transporter ExbD [Phycisphaeraceae bacterium]|nr:biopolymer transporter ExbD [Phycisphaeraceae bacterium]
MSDAIRRRRRRRRKPIAVPVASMGDIAFLLIIFFMVCSNFAKEKPVELPTAPAIDRLDRTQISVQINEHGTIFINGQAVPDADAVEWGVGSLVTKRGLEDPIVYFKCDRSVSRATFEPVLDALAAAGVKVASVGQRDESPQTSR